MEFLAIIPARGGSKGIPHKNIRKFNGRPLISYTIAQAKKSKFITRVAVSTEAENIAAISKKYGAEVPCLRPKSLAKDNSKAVDAVLHLLDYLKTKENYVPDYIVALQVTSPMRLVEDIDGAISLLLKRKADAVVSLCATEQLLYIKDKKDLLKMVSDEKFLKSTNRQELLQTYKLDGSMVYAIKTKVFLKEKSFLAGKLIGYVIPRWRALDLDEPQDFVVSELIFRHRNKLARKIKNFI
ncbi:MAG: acylneuraminate cytidylyltransferase family protein [Patescibacteria group bacterium]|nr:acylneuraminate cytidylyltransferase family protein [Patescibacteria group bacterium]